MDIQLPQSAYCDKMIMFAAMNIKRKIGMSVRIVLLSFLVVAALIMALNPEFGGEPTKEQKARFKASKNYWDGKFHSLNDRKLEMTFTKFKAIREAQKKKSPFAEPKTNIPVIKQTKEVLIKYKEGTQIVWFGHSSLYLQSNGVKLLIDPVFSERPSPFSFIGAKRFSKDLTLEIEQLPTIDAIVISHDHYDHLDYETICALKDKVHHFFTPLGVGSHLQRWGVPAKNITELDWHEQTTFKSIKLTCTPALHYSSRGKWLSDRAKYLWSSWVIKTEDKNIFFSGDSGYDEHFKRIGEQYGPFDLAMMECGQYNPNWKENHMSPEESAQASYDVKAKVVLPIHWGAFTLAMHHWLDPIRRISKVAHEKEIFVSSPRIGEIVDLDNLERVDNNWWKEFEEPQK